MRTKFLLVLATFTVLLGGVMPAQAIHWYRGPGGGCTPADGALTDDPEGTAPNVVATVILGHNSFSRGVSGFDAQTAETSIEAGQSVRWTWNSSHCHSVTSVTRIDDKPMFDSGYHYPATEPESQRAVPGFFEYPELDETPTLSYTRTFATPGRYAYTCVHHGSIGMNGVIVVE